jgi:hypothetical protein
VIVDLYEKVCLADKRHDPVPIEYAQPLATPEGGFKVGLCDRLGTWCVVAVVLVVIAYAIPPWDLLSLDRFGRPGFKPF